MTQSIYENEILNLLQDLKKSRIAGSFDSYTVKQTRCVSFRGENVGNVKKVTSTFDIR